MNLRRDRLDPPPAAPDCPCTALQTARATALVDLRVLAADAAKSAGTNRALTDFALDILNRIRGL